MDRKEITNTASINSALLTNLLQPTGNNETGHRELPWEKQWEISYAKADLNGTVEETKVIPVSSQAGSKGALQNPVEQLEQELRNIQQRTYSKKEWP